MALLNTLLYMTRHELAGDRPIATIGRWLRWQVGSRLVPGPVALPFVGSTRLLVSRGMTGATGNYYCGLHEFADMSFALHLLREGDVFIDIGANVGSYTILAAGACGARVVAVEPAPAAHAALIDNIGLNGLRDRVQVLEALVGGTPGQKAMSIGLDTINHVLPEAQQQAARSLQRAVTTLDDLSRGLSPVLIKIDVEGFETEVLRGGADVLAAPTLQAVIMELDGSGRRYGFDEARINESMLAAGFSLCRYDGRARRLTELPGKVAYKGNSLYVRDAGFVKARIAGAPLRIVAGVAV